MDKLGVGLIGAGQAGALFGKAINASSNGRLVALAAATQQEADTVGATLEVGRTTDDWKSLLDDTQVQAIFVASPTYLHHEMTIAAARAGKHVLCDKPLCLTSQQADEMLAACREAGVLFMVGFIERFNAAFRVARERIRQGEIGKPVMVFARRVHPPRKGSWIMDDSKSGGAFLHTGCHNIDLVQWLFDSPITQISAEQVESGNFPGFTDVSAVIGTMENGVLVSLLESYAHPTGLPMGVDRSMEILGTKGVLYLDLLRSPVTLCTEDGWKYQDVLTWVDAGGELSGALTEETEYFLNCVQQGKQPDAAPAVEGKRTIAVFEAAKKAAQTGNRQRVV
ncbi:MAG TPA: Gfo/Idh/MocA family oxidoreductase [Abditibacteriaceae bacterium]|nr:Gfo/Idh/MocA family oxidoreductase [Abditibacteriaceae bacterium]